MRNISTIAALLLAVSLVVPSQASIDSGDLVRLTDGPGTTAGGAFNVEDLTAPLASDFFTFCVEKNEGVVIPGDYYVTVEPDAIFGGVGVLDIGGAGAAGVLGSYDPLSPLTAWLYSNALAGTLTGYTASSPSDNDALQNAIWYIENEQGSLPSELAEDFYDAAVLAAPTSIGNVRVMNLWESAAAAASHDPLGKKQSMLVIVPEASTIAVWSVLSLAGIGVAYKKHHAKLA